MQAERPELPHLDALAVCEAMARESCGEGRTKWWRAHCARIRDFCAVRGIDPADVERLIRDHAADVKRANAHRLADKRRIKAALRAEARAAKKGGRDAG